MKVLVFYASYGGGHLNAAKSIENYILNNYNIDDNEIITVNEVANIWSNMLKHISFTSGNQV